MNRMAGALNSLESLLDRLSTQIALLESSCSSTSTPNSSPRPTPAGLPLRALSPLSPLPDIASDADGEDDPPCDAPHVSFEALDDELPPPAPVAPAPEPVPAVGTLGAKRRRPKVKLQTPAL